VRLRSLWHQGRPLDYISVAVDCKGLAHNVYGGNTKVQEAAGEALVHVANQTGGTALAPPAERAVPVP